MSAIRGSMRQPMRLSLRTPFIRGLAATVQYPLDNLDAAAAYSLRKLRGAYTGPLMRVRRSSDNAEADIGYGADGWLDEASLLAHVGAGSGFVTTWYDQSGNGRNATQATAASQPAFSATGFNGKPTIQHDGIDDFLSANTAAQAIGSQAFTLLGVIRFPTSISSGGYIISLREGAGGSTTRGYLYHNSNTFFSAWGNPFTACPGIPVADGTNVILGVQRRTGGVAESFVNGVAGGSITANFPSPFGQMSFGSLQQQGFTDSWFSEVVISTGTMTTTDRQKLERNQGAAFGVTVA